MVVVHRLAHALYAQQPCGAGQADKTTLLERVVDATLSSGLTRGWAVPLGEQIPSGGGDVVNRLVMRVGGGLFVVLFPLLPEGKLRDRLRLVLLLLYSC